MKGVVVNLVQINPVSIQHKESRTKRWLQYLSYPLSNIASEDPSVTLQLVLDNDEGKIGLWVHVTRHLLNFLNLLLDLFMDTVDQIPRGITVGRRINQAGAT